MRIFLLIIGFWLLLTKVVLSYIPITLTADPTIACIGCSISFSVNSPCNLTGATFYWDFGDGQTETTNTPYTSHTYTNPGNYTASVLVVKSNDSGSTNTSLEIHQLGSFTIDAERVFDVPGDPLKFHIHAFQTELKDTNGSYWNLSASRCMHVLYSWWNCFDGRWFDSYHVSEYTFPSIFEVYLFNSTAVKGWVSSECGWGSLESQVVYILYSRKVQ
jgi:PKD repeat protein